MIKKVGLYKDKTLKGVKWRVRWFGKYDPTNGREKRYGRTFALKKDAERFLKEIDANFEQGTPRDPSKIELKEYGERCLSNKIAIEGIRPATVKLYRESLGKLYGYFGQDCLLRTIDQEAAKNFLAAIKPVKKNKSSLTNWTKRRILVQCKAIFLGAVKEKIIPANPFDDIKSGKCITPEWYRVKPSEYLTLLDVTANLSEKVLYALCYTAGLREAEALSLRWDSVDFDKGMVSVVNQTETPKLPPFNIKDSEKRSIPIPEHTLNLLTCLHNEATEGMPYVVLTGERYQRVLAKWQQCRKEGRAWETSYWANNVLRNFKLRVKRAGINPLGKKLDIHVLRKSCIQNWLITYRIMSSKNLLDTAILKRPKSFTVRWTKPT